MHIFRTALCLIAAAVPLLADNVETQHAFDYKLAVRPKLELTLHSRIRTQPGGLGFYQLRTGPVFSWDVSRRVSLLGGYYFGKQETKSDREFVATHRPFGGAEISVFENARVSLDQRVLAERFLSESFPNFTRYRFRSHLSAKGAVAPYTAHEFFFDHEGWRNNRHSAGIRWKLRRGVQVEFGYLYEYRRPDAGAARHIIFTSIQLTKPQSSSAGKR